MPTNPAIEARAWTSSELDLQVTNLGYQGDGFYSASFNESGVAEVKFTPLSEVLTDEPEASVSAETLSARDSNLDKRATTCSGRFAVNQGDLDTANRQLRDNAVNMGASQGAWGHWGWVHIGDSTAYFCNYETNVLTAGLLSDMQAIVTSKCTPAGYGYDRRAHCCGANDLAVGRTFRGDEFCASGFRG
ncbi:hypothetical protein DHEL01_v212726 [Diaporthe helianthi]|uniref:Uncharacterized protein n=1 Tax=Diaporthe helianthi TaxID=158607 RepID=A0A2P5HF57_DIAHE|nr:hypothetical protein DHEL01_v212726 [Diaporthe helianthi]